MNSRGGKICFNYLNSGTCRFGSTCKYAHVEPGTGSGFESSVQRPQGARTRPKQKRRGKSQRRDHIGDFFADYPEFDYDQSAEIWSEFYRMCEEFEWGREDHEKKEARERFKSAMVLQFNDLYGTDGDDLNAWQGLCRVLNIVPVPSVLNECRKLVRRTHVNLVDLVDAPRTGARVEVFANLKELQDYTTETAKYFPKEDAYAGGLLKYLLRDILGGPKGNRQRVSW